MSRCRLSALCLLSALILPLALTRAPARTGQESPAVAPVACEGEGAKYWPRWRGPSGQGVAADGAYPDTWSATDNVLWKVAVPGKGNSSPVVWGDRVFLTTALDRGQKRAILCLDRADGKLLWQTFAPDSPVDRVQAKNGHASGTPTTDGERVYAYFGNPGVVCVDFQGKQVWHHSFGELKVFHGPACSPLLYKDLLILFQDHQTGSGSFVLALDKRTGKEVWKTPRQEKLGWGSPFAVRAGDRDEIIVSGQFAVYSYDPATGQELWKSKGNLVEVTPTPVAGHGLIYCCSGRNGPTLAIKPGGQGDVSKTHTAWSVKANSPFIPSPLLYGDYLYMIDDVNCLATCYEAKTGKRLWQEPLGPRVKHGFSASPVGVNGKVFFTADDGDVYVLAAGPKFQLLHTNKLGEATLASPALVEGRWYWRTAGHLWCIGKKQ